MEKILIVEDDNSIRDNILELLDAENFNVFAARNGRIGLELANKEIPDLIICDVMMPELDGYGVLHKLRENPITAAIPFVFLTAKSSRKDFRQGMDLGADDYLTKPFTKDELVKIIRCRLEKQFAINQKSQSELSELRNCITHALPHEMRTPLNGILGFSQILMREHNTLEKQEIYEMATDIYQSANRLFDFTKKFLQYAQLESIAKDSDKIKDIQSQSTPFPLDSLILLINQKSEILGRKNDLEIALDKLCTVRISVTRLYTIIEELIDNCLKFSEPNTPISVTSSIIDNYLTLSFSNYGRGMSALEIKNLGAYRQFHRRIYEQQGSGLGLTIVRLLAELYGGSLDIQSTPGGETVVKVKLPLV